MPAFKEICYTKQKKKEGNCMERLSSEQSALLNKLASESQLYSSLSDSEKVICDFLIKQEYIKPTYIHRSSSSSGVFRSWSEIDIVSISEAGKMYLINEKLSIDQILFLEEQMKALRDLADTAIADSKSARKDALFSKIFSCIAVVISIAAIIVPIITC